MLRPTPPGETNTSPGVVVRGARLYVEVEVRSTAAEPKTRVEGEGRED